MAVSYQEAIETLKSMFGDTEEAVIVSRLEANNGHMEHTVNDLLAMANGEVTPNQAMLTLFA